METISLRFGEHFTPKCGTVAAHQKIIDELGYVWYGKLGSKVSKDSLLNIMKLNNPKILLISSGKSERYWAYLSEFSYEQPANNEFPQYYADKTDSIKTWFKITRIEPAKKDVMAMCHVISSGKTLGDASKHSMSPYFKIRFEEEGM